jgi:hypothetical protein
MGIGNFPAYKRILRERGKESLKHAAAECGPAFPVPVKDGGLTPEKNAFY